MNREEKVWGLGIGDWGLGPIPNPQSPIPYLLYYTTIIIYYILKSIKKYYDSILNIL